ncbi:hypothetical protein GCM10029963_79770 [Micromonospora andamanensis]
MTTQMALADATTGDATGLVRRLEHHLAALETRRGQLVTNIARQHEEIDRARTQLGQPFARHDELVDTRRRMRAVSAAVDAIADLDSVPVNTTGAPAVPVTLDDAWMPDQVRDSLTDDERTWLTNRLHRVANAETLQAAARAQDDVAAFAGTFDKALTAMLGDPDQPNLSVAIFLKCDDPDWRTSLFNAARQAVHDTVRATPVPTPNTGTTGIDSDRPRSDSPGPPQIVLTDDEIRTLVPKLAAALTRDEKIWLNQATNHLWAQPDLRAVAQANDPARFAQLFGPAITAQVVDAPGRLAELATGADDLAAELRAVIQHVVYIRIRTEPEPPAATVPVSDAAKVAAVVATAFPSATTATPSPTPPSATASRGTAPATEPEPTR